MQQPAPAHPATAALLRFYAAEEVYVASGRTDFAAIAKTLHPDIVLHQPASLPYGGVWRGHAGFHQWLDAFAATWSAVRPRDPIFHESGADTLISLVTMEADARDTGRPVSLPMCQIIRLQDGLPIEWRNFCWDTAVVLQALAPDVKDI